MPSDLRIFLGDCSTRKRFLDRINKMDKIHGKAVAESGLEIFLPAAHPL